MVFLFFFSSSMLRTPVTGLYLTPFISSLRIDIHPQYITRSSVKVSSRINADKLVGNIEHFILCYPSYNTITLQSHILRHGIRNRIANNLKKSILYKEKARKTPLCETIVLNLRYGEKPATDCSPAGGIPMDSEYIAMAEHSLFRRRIINLIFQEQI